jgi:hypothetical protein
MAHEYRPGMKMYQVIWERDGKRVAYEQTDLVKSFRQYLALAEKGSVWGMAAVGQMFF